MGNIAVSMYRGKRKEQNKNYSWNRYFTDVTMYDLLILCGDYTAYTCTVIHNTHSAWKQWTCLLMHTYS